MSLTERSFETLALREIEDETLEVRLNRPDRLNALTGTMVGEIIEVFEGLANDRKTRVVILTGEGRGFCSGADMQDRAGPGFLLVTLVPAICCRASSGPEWHRN